ncbi:acyltransferase family protein [Alicyclobacillus ferrooxydans]|uniref:Acyltransferase n=1 Tax=Alicyclobacillus ferrooxydans TaxID=471514 RepID=A0A0P9CTB2_9BACL|nr:acyltransferase family protein [Alicyclobacillus ferrooxydans]KPV42886.1 acyltransferase [Alicyclobacillus ferrooxydans]
MERKGNGRYIAGLDGLRAIAILSVIAYHLNLSFAPGGLLGVGVFFVLSGYLITDLLIAEWQVQGRISLKHFWTRRARRLLPAMLTMLIVVLLWVASFQPTQLFALKEDAWSAIFYVSNWWFIFHKVSYFASFGPPTPLGHLWSLAVEEQFYIVWPLFLLLALRFLKRRGWLLTLVLIGAAASATAMGVLYHPGTDPSRVYYGTDTRAFSLLIGAALAIGWPSRKLSMSLSRVGRNALDAAALLSLIGIFILFWQTNEYQTFLYRGGMIVLSVLTAITIAAAAHPACRFGRIMGVQPLRWLGLRSYGIYLWHYPVIILTTPSVDTGHYNVLRAVLQVAASFVLAELSYRFVEKPIRYGLTKHQTGIKEGGKHRKQTGWRRQLLSGNTAVLLLIGASMGMTELLPQAAAKSSEAVAVNTGASDKQGSGLATGALPSTGANETSTASEAGAGQPSTVSNSSQGGTAKAGSSVSLTPSQINHKHKADVKTSSPPTKSSSGESAPLPTQQLSPLHSGKGVTAIGDSVMVDAKPYLQQLLPGIVVDGLVGRQMIQAPSEIARLKANGELGDRVIIELGTNGPFTKAQLVTVIQDLGPVKQIVLVNTRVPRPWQDVVNATLASVAASYPNITLVNWYALSANLNNDFYPDGVHLNPQGAAYYASILAKAVQ